MSERDVTVLPGTLSGSIAAVPSKSLAHRIILLASLADGTTEISCPATSADIEATLGCVEALGAKVKRTDGGFRVTGIPVAQGAGFSTTLLDCGESGSTLRFLLPVVAALGEPRRLVGHGRLAKRPLSPLYEQLVDHGTRLSEQGAFPLEVAGPLAGGTFVLPGNVSSQYVSGLLMAAPVVDEPVTVIVTKPVESLPYIELTIQALAAFGVEVVRRQGVYEGKDVLFFEVQEGRLVSPEKLSVEGDWSNAAFWLAAGALSDAGVTVTGLDEHSAQGDRAIISVLERMGAEVSCTPNGITCRHRPLRGIVVDVSDIPDLVPPLAAVATYCEGTARICNAGRLRLKESDRLETVSAAINAVGGSARLEGDDLVINGCRPASGVIDAANDHRIAMMAAVLATRASGSVCVSGASCVSKSYPRFWDDFALLGGVILPA